jgi:hypothetical protein
MTAFDLWKTTPPQAEYRPFRCTGCRERVWETEDWNEDDVHCYDEDSGEPAGSLQYDWSYDWRDDDPSIP